MSSPAAVKPENETIALMLPSATVVLATWRLLLVAWFQVAIPWGPGSPVDLPVNG